MTSLDKAASRPLSSTVQRMAPARALSALEQENIISQFADALCLTLPAEWPESGKMTLATVTLPGQGRPEQCYFSGLNADGSEKDPRVRGLPLVMIIQGARTATGYNPSLLPGGKTALDKINEADGVEPGTRFLDEMYGRTDVRLIHTWDPRAKTVSVVLTAQESHRPRWVPRPVRRE